MKNRKSPGRARQGGRRRDAELRPLVIPTVDGLAEISIRDPRSATVIGRYWNAVRRFLETGDDSKLQRFQGKHVMTAAGDAVPLLTDLDELERLGAAGVLSFESIYARVG
jgi:hypothetical protein